MSFKFTVKECFKLSTGATSFVGTIEPKAYPIITSNDFVVEIKSSSGKSYRFNSINEDLFSRANPMTDNIFRSLQTFENVDVFITEMKSYSISIYGYKK